MLPASSLSVGWLLVILILPMGYKFQGYNLFGEKYEVNKSCYFDRSIKFNECSSYGR